MQISQRFDYCLSLKYALKLSFHIKCPGKVSGHAGKNVHMFLFTYRHLQLSLNGPIANVITHDVKLDLTDLYNLDI